MADTTTAGWDRQPEAEALLAKVLAEAFERAPAALLWARALRQGCGVRLRDIIDHVGFCDAQLPQALAAAGWSPMTSGTWRCPAGYFPDFVAAERLTLAFRCESVERLAATLGLGAPMEGAAHGPYRRIEAFAGDGAAFVAVERNGWAAYDLPAEDAGTIRLARLHLQSFRARRRSFDTVEAGLDHTEALVVAAVADIGAHWACDLFFRAEREYWMRDCAAGRLQKARQDGFGLGWANVDHHTYDASRALFAQTIRILERLGYQCRELFYAGAEAGWGSQILEQPVLRSTIFADIDLAPEELDIDFAHQPLPPLPVHRRAGLWCALHGESMLEAGLNHVAGLYDHAALSAQLEAAGVRLMQPFSDFPHLYQQLTEGGRRAVDPRRVHALQQEGHLQADEAEDFRLNGAIATHLENLERNDGFKGFNQPGIDGVLRIIDPRRNMIEA